ncbi:hypothetical protein F5Y11DRAFT_316778 [Daldinia sp. FL1419]|nr:hypothetical protein F5Y11DRAFT_316778 [Daldinia sp. FL1419]
MVFTLPLNGSLAPAPLNAYLLTDLSDDELNSFKKAFEYGTFAPFGTMLELVIKKAPEDYLNKPHSYIREKETEAGRIHPFILIDEQLALKGAVWYVDDFARDYEVEGQESIAEASVLWEILVETESLAVAWANYDVGNIHIHEDLIDCGVDTPVRESFTQPKVHSCGHEDVIEPLRYTHYRFITAEPDEFEESTDEEVLAKMAPRPDVAYRLKGDTASKLGVRNDWVDGEKTERRALPDGTVKEFPIGSVTLSMKIDPDFAWPAYKWPEGSL